MALGAHGVVWNPDPQLIAWYPQVYGATPEQRVHSLASALASGPMWAELRTRSAVVVRPATGAIGILGAPQPPDDPRLEALATQVPDVLRRLRPVDLGAVQSLTGRLADRLRPWLPDTLDGVRLAPIPRGGLIVAGFLSYHLGLPAEDLDRGDLGAADVLLVVDDCVLSGARLRRWLRSRPGPEVVVAHLHSHPDLRAAVEAGERVVACVAAADLRDHAPARYGEGYEAWQARWRERSPDDYWTGLPDHVVYPWNEPDTLIWNEQTGTSESGWRVVPPAWCAKNRAEAAPVQECRWTPGPVGPPDDVVWAEVQDAVIVACGSTGTSVRLEGSGAELWRALAATGDEESAVRRLAGRFEAEPERLARDVRIFVDRLSDAGLLARVVGP